jgi:leucyl-tRNA synthetase
MGEKPVASGSSAGAAAGADAPASLLKLLHKTIAKVGHDTDTLNFNTAISAMMIYSAELNKLEVLPLGLWEPLVKMVGPYAPHLGEELWSKLGRAESLAKAPWPVADPSLAADDVATVVVQVNGKVRDKLEVPMGLAQDELKARALALPKVQEWIGGKTIAKVVVVPNKLVSVVLK